MRNLWHAICDTIEEYNEFFKRKNAAAWDALDILIGGTPILDFFILLGSFAVVICHRRKKRK